MSIKVKKKIVLNEGTLRILHECGFDIYNYETKQ